VVWRYSHLNGRRRGLDRIAAKLDFPNKFCGYGTKDYFIFLYCLLLCPALSRTFCPPLFLEWSGIIFEKKSEKLVVPEIVFCVVF
jgi:hypothetical protein